MTDVIETGTATEVVPKPRKKRVWTDEQRQAASKRSKARWRKKKKAGVSAGEIAPAKANPGLSGESAPMKGPAPMKARLTAYGVNPNTGAVELFSQDLAESMGDLLPNLIALLYNGSVMTEIRLEQR